MSGDGRAPFGAVDMIGGDARTYRAIIRASIVTADTFAKFLAAATLVAATTVLPAKSGAQDLRCGAGDTEVRGLEFSGNRVFTDAELANVIVTTPSSWARRYLNIPFTARRCLNATEFANDRLRLILFYRRRGFPGVQVDTALTPSGAGGVRVRFAIHEGRATILRSFVIQGLDSLPNRRDILADLPISAGQRFDRTAIDATIDLITRRLRNGGYPAVAARSSYGTADSAASAFDTLTIAPGARTLFGHLAIAVTPAPHAKQQVPDRMVKRIIGIDSGTPFREQAIIDAQRALYQTDAYTHVAIALDSASGRRIAADSVAPVDISLAENSMHAARIGGGYGTLDCFRATGELDDYNFLRGARHLTLQTRVSKIGIGRPLDGAAESLPASPQRSLQQPAQLLRRRDAGAAGVLRPAHGSDAHRVHVEGERVSRLRENDDHWRNRIGRVRSLAADARDVRLHDGLRPNRSAASPLLRGVQPVRR